MNETEANLAIVSETWFKDEMVKELQERFSQGEGFQLVTRNREAGQNRVAYGGIALIWRESFVRMKEIVFKNPERYEMVVAAGSMKGHTRKLLAATSRQTTQKREPRGP